MEHRELTKEDVTIPGTRGLIQILVGVAFVIVFIIVYILENKTVPKLSQLLESILKVLGQ